MRCLQIAHNKLATAAEEAALDPQKEPVAVKLKPENLELAFPFIVQSGGEYNLKWSSGSNEKRLARASPNLKP